MRDLAPDDSHWMRRALAEAPRGLGRVEPNPLVGAAIVQNGQLLAVGHHDRFGGPHAEINALARAGEAARGATLYVTLEPCCHHGKTPPCTEAVIQAGIARVVAAMRDPFPRVAGGGFVRLREAGIEVVSGIELSAAQRLNAPYLKRLATGLPYVTAKWAMTLDGKMACRTGDSRWISNAQSRARVHELRGRMDAIVVGIGTALADDPLLTCRPPGPRTPVRVVLDSAARLPLESQLLQTIDQAPLLIAITDQAPPHRVPALQSAGARVLAFPGHGPVPILPLLRQLSTDGATHVLVEGGPRVLGAFLDAHQVDAVQVSIAPILEGGTHPNVPFAGTGLDRMANALRLEHHQFAQLDGDLLLRGTFPHPWLDADAP